MVKVHLSDKGLWQAQFVIEYLDKHELRIVNFIHLHDVFPEIDVDDLRIIVGALFESGFISITRS